MLRADNYCHKVLVFSYGLTNRGKSGIILSKINSICYMKLALTALEVLMNKSSVLSLLFIMRFYPLPYPLVS